MRMFCLFSNYIFVIIFQTLMSVFRILYLLNMRTLPITVMVTPTVPTPKDHSIARVTRDTLEMEFCVLVILLDIFCGMQVDLKCIYFWYIENCPCTDINECEPSGLAAEYQYLAHMCHGDANCTNTKGSYNCGCQDGYYGNGRKCEGDANFTHFRVF